MPSESPTAIETAPTSTIVQLSRVECHRLLRETTFGRLAVALGAGAPVIRPVNYVFDERTNSVIFRTDLGSKFFGLARAAKAAFEIDGIDDDARTGWSVIISGISEEITSLSEIHRLERLGLDPWAPGAKSHWVRIRAYTVSGRRIILPPRDIPPYVG